MRSPDYTPPLSSDAESARRSRRVLNLDGPNERVILRLQYLNGRSYGKYTAHDLDEIVR